MSVDSEAQFGENLSESSSEGAVSLQRLASARQVKISNHTMIVPSQLPPEKKLPSYTLNKKLYRGRRARGHASESIC